MGRPAKRKPEIWWPDPGFRGFWTITRLVPLPANPASPLSADAPRCPADPDPVPDRRLAVLAPAAPPTPAAAATEAAHQAAMEGYLYFYPLLVMDLTRRQAAHPSQNTPPNAYAFVRSLPQAGAAAPGPIPTCCAARPGWT